MTDLPDGWEWTTVGELGEYINGRGFKKTEWSETGRPIIRIQNLTGSGSGFNHFSRDLEDRYVVPTGALLVSWAATLGVYRWDGPEGALNQHIFRVRSFVNEDFHRYLLEHALDLMQGHTHGSGMVHITRGRFDATPAPLPPLAEQERLVAAVEEALSKLDAGEAGLRTVRQLLKRMRDAVLAAAVTGRLVPQDPTDTPADKFLADLGAHALDDLRRGLPDSWQVVPLWQVAEIRLGRQRSPQRATGPRMRPYLRAANVGWDGLRLGDVKEMSFTEAESEIFELTLGDLLLAEASGSPGEVGKPAQYRNEVPGGCCFQNTLIRVRLKPGLDSDYYEHFFRHEARTGRFASGSRGVGIHHLGQKALRGWLVPVPPPEEQVRLVTEVERQFSFLDACERAVDAGLGRAAATRRAVLKAAFEGRLVPQDPSDEPASVLLERIRAERVPKAKS